MSANVLQAFWLLGRFERSALDLKVHRNPSNFAFICTQVGLILDIFWFFVCKKHYFEK